MKVSQANKVFSPVTITLYSKEEVQALFLCLNTTFDDLKKDSYNQNAKTMEIIQDLKRNAPHVINSMYWALYSFDSSKQYNPFPTYW